MTFQIEIGKQSHFEKWQNKDETASHILCACEAVASLRPHHLELYFTKLSDYLKTTSSKVLHFIWSVELLGG